MVGEGEGIGINGGFSSPEKMFRTNVSKANTKFCSSLRYNADNSYFSVKGWYIYDVYFEEEGRG